MLSFAAVKGSQKDCNIQCILWYASEGYSLWVHQCVFLCISEGDSLKTHVSSSYPSVFSMPFSQYLDNPALSAPFYIYIPVLMLMYYWIMKSLVSTPERPIGINISRPRYSSRLQKQKVRSLMSYAEISFSLPDFTESLGSEVCWFWANLWKFAFLWASIWMSY